MLGLWSQFDFSLWLAGLLALGAVLAAIATAIWRMTAGRQAVAPAARVLAVGTTLVVVVSTGLPHGWPPVWAFGDLVLQPGRGGLAEWRVLVDSPDSLAAVLLLSNVALYVPVGLFGVLGWPARRRSVLLACVALSLGIELVQLAALDRVASTDDVLLNMAGSVLGVLLGGLLVRVQRTATTRRAAADSR